MRKPRAHTIHQSHQKYTAERGIIFINKFIVSFLYRSELMRRDTIVEFGSLIAMEILGALMQLRPVEGT